jgi:two-component system, cell cycle response regulator DivK
MPLPGVSGAPRVLLVEDHEWSARLLRVLLRDAGFEVRSAADGRETLAVAGGFRPHLVLMDLELPDASGLELTRALKASAGTRDSVVVVLTAHSPEDVAGAVREAGGAGVLAKPVDPLTFGATVRSYLPK